MKKMVYIVVGICVALVVVGIVKDVAIKIAVEKGVEMVTGLPLHMGGFRLGILTGVVDIKNLQIFNPAGFSDKTMARVPEIYVRCNIPAAIGGTIHLPEVRLDVAEVTIVKNKFGAVNVNSLKVVQANSEGKKPAEMASAGKSPQIRIDKLRLKIGKVVYKDYTAAGGVSVKEFPINIDEEYTDITNPYAVVSLIVVKSLTNTTIANVTNIDVQGLQGGLNQSLAATQKVATQTVKKVAAETSKQAEAAVGKATDALKGVFNIQ